jgi:hypothetical protein
MELKELIIKYYNSDNINEKSELKNELLKKKNELNLPLDFELAVRGHYDTFINMNRKIYIENMLKHAY